eukprot:2313657-Amphidinium_carterae.2
MGVTTLKHAQPAKYYRDLLKKLTSDSVEESAGETQHALSIIDDQALAPGAAVPLSIENEDQEEGDPGSEDEEDAQDMDVDQSRGPKHDGTHRQYQLCWCSG